MELKGKRVLFLGSSVTYGAASGGVSFAELMAERCEMQCLKEAVSGTVLTLIGLILSEGRFPKAKKHEN